MAVTSAMNWAVEAAGLIKSYRRSWWSRERKMVLTEVSLQIKKGSIFGILGPNGAGKTTLISILATLLRPEGGWARVLGLDVVREAAKLRPQLNLVSGAGKFVWSLTVEDNLRFYGRLYGLWGRELAARLEEVIGIFALQEWRRQTFENLSTGVKQRLALAKAFLTRPALLFLDEPTTGLDLLAAAHTREEIQRLNRETGITIILTTHNLREAENLCDEVAFLREGRLVAQGQLADLQTKLALGDRLTIYCGVQPPLAVFQHLPGILRLASADGGVELVLDNAEVRLATIVTTLRDRGIQVERLRLQPVNLEELYREITH